MADVGVALARGEQQRRHAALRVHQLVDEILAVERRATRGRGAGRGAAAPRARRRWRLGLGGQVAAVGVLAVGAERHQVDDLGRGVLVGAAREQQLHDVDAVGGGGEHQRRLPAVALLGVRRRRRPSSSAVTAAVSPDAAANISGVAPVLVRGVRRRRRP